MKDFDDTACLIVGRSFPVIMTIFLNYNDTVTRQLLLYAIPEISSSKLSRRIGCNIDIFFVYSPLDVTFNYT